MAMKDESLISISEAASRVGMDQKSFRECLLQNKFPFHIGIAIKKPGNKNWTYYIYRKKIEKLEQFWGFVD